jgi:hypothetical protein
MPATPNTTQKKANSFIKKTRCIRYGAANLKRVFFLHKSEDGYSADSLPAVPRYFSSHSPAALIEFVAVDNRFDVSTRCGEIDLLKKLAGCNA